MCVIKYNRIEGITEVTGYSAGLLDPYQEYIS